MYTCFVMEINHLVIPDFFVNLKLNFVFVKLEERIMSNEKWICPIDYVEVTKGEKCPICKLNKDDAEKAEEEQEEFEDEMMKATVYGNYRNWPY